MSNVNDVLGQSGSGEQIEALGKTWTLTHVGPGIRARYSAWVKARAQRELTQQKPYLDEVEYRERMASLQEQQTAGAYNWGSPLSPRAMGSAVQTMFDSEEGRIRLVQELLHPTHGEVEPGKVVEILEAAPEEMALALAACLGLGPNRQTPTERTTSGNPETSGQGQVAG